MKKDLEEILKQITPETAIEEVASYCDTVEDFELIIKNLPSVNSGEALVSDNLKQKALRLAKIFKSFNQEVTTANIQKCLKLPYPQALAIYEWLKKEAHI